MKAPSAGYRIMGQPGDWVVVDDEGPTSPVVWHGKTFRGARTAHYRLSIARITGKPVSYAQARRAGNA